MDRIFSDDDLAGLFDDHAYGFESYTEAAPSDELIAEVETELGYRLPAAYIELCRTVRNGGTLDRSCFPTTGVHVWAEDHVAVTGLYAIGRTSHYSLLGSMGSRFMEQEWEYPAIGVYFADTPTAGHSEFALDYRECGPQGEPAVVVVDQEDEYRVSSIAKDFATFIRGLVSEEEFQPDPEEERAEYLAIVNEGSFSPIVQRGIDAIAETLPGAGAAVREVGRRIVADKGFFSLHADANSHLMYAAMFLLYSTLTTARSRDEFIDGDPDAVEYSVPCYRLMLPVSFVADRFGFTTGGWARDFVADWWDQSVENGSIVETPDGFRYTADTEAGLVRILRMLAKTTT